MNTKLAIGLLMGALVTGCGTTPQDRVLGGASLGAGAGALLGAVTGLTVIEGAAIGAAAGALSGALTDAERVNLGDPVWKRANPSAAAADPTVIRVQNGLARLGYDPGPVDGRMGPKTAHAVRAYQRAHGLLEDGRASTDLARHIEARGS